MNKLKALSSVGIQFWLLHIIFLPPVSLVLSLPLMIAEKQSSGLLVFATLQIYALLMLGSVLSSAFTILGPTPSDKRSFKWTANQREMTGGANLYDYACVLPLTRRQLVKPVALIWLPLITIDAAEIIIAAVNSYTDEMGPIIAFHSLTFFFILAAVPLTCFVYRSAANTVGLIIVFTLAPAVFITMFIFMLTDIPIPYFMPSSAAIALPVIAVIFNFLILYFTGFNGDYARNGEKILKK